MLRRLTVIGVLFVLLPVSAADAFLHLHDDPEHYQDKAPNFTAGIFHTHFETGAPADEPQGLRADSGQGYRKARFANLFRFVPDGPFVPVICLETVPLRLDRECSSSRVVELIPSAHDPPSLECSIPRSPPA